MIVVVCRCQLCPLDKHCELMFGDLRIFFSLYPPHSSFSSSSSVSNERLNLSEMSAATWRSKTASECEPQPVNAFGLRRGLEGWGVGVGE